MRTQEIFKIAIQLLIAMPGVAGQGATVNFLPAPSLPE